MAGLNGSSNILAQCVPALARASQLLCTVSQPDQARDALRQAAGLLEGNGRFAEIAAVKELADRCRVTAQTGTERELVAACRQLGATVARQMTALTQEIQRQAKAPAKPAAPAPAPPPAKPVEPVKPVIPPEPVEAARPAEKPVPVEKARPVVPPKPLVPARPAPIEKPRPVEEPVAAPAAKVPDEKRPVEKVKPAPRPSVVPGLVERITVARTAAEKAAVTLALQDGKRFAVVGNGTIIDTKTNRMWRRARVRSQSTAVRRGMPRTCGWQTTRIGVCRHRRSCRGW